MGWQLRAVLGFLLVVLMSSLVFLIDRNGYQRGKADCQATQAKVTQQAQEAHEKKVVAADEGMQKAIDQGDKAKASAEEQTKVVVRTITKVIHDSPSPVSCVAQPASVHELNEAIARANAATDRLQGKRTGAEASPGTPKP